VFSYCFQFILHCTHTVPPMLNQVSSRQGNALCSECLWNVTVGKVGCNPQTRSIMSLLCPQADYVAACMQVRYAMRNMGCIRHGDRVMLALSGGESNTLHCTRVTGVTAA
jgi:hypothetical protein